MFKKDYATVIFTVALFLLTLTSELQAEITFDFALPLFKQEEINFEKTKPADYNFQLLKKYLLEHEANVIAQFHAINRWFTLIKLSDTPRQKELLTVGNTYFSTKNNSKATKEEKLREIFYKGILLTTDKTEDPENKKDQEFEELLLEAEEELAENPDYWIAKGIIFQSLKNRPNNYFSLMKPEEDLKTALTLIPRTAQYYYLIGQCFRYLGNNDSSLFLSIAAYEKASSLDPRNPKLQNSLLSIYMGLHEDYQSKSKQEPFWLEEAVYKKILEISPANAHALNNLGYLYAEYGVNTQTAQELCQRAVSLNPENPGFHDSLGWAAFKNKDFQLAEESLIRSISMRNNVFEPHYHLATVYYANKQLDKAAVEYEVAIRLRPDSAIALNNLAYLYAEQNKKVQEALKMAVTVNKLEPNNPTYLDTLGWAYYRNGDLENALINLLKANNLAPGEGEILLHIGRVYLDKNDFENALTYVKEAFKASPEMSDPDETLYLTIRLKAYHEAMADYHGLLGERADKDKLISILTGIARLYQDEGLYEKSIEITKICSELKNGSRSLSEPLLNSYKLHFSKSSPAKSQIEQEIISEEKQDEDQILEVEEENPKESSKSEPRLQTKAEDSNESASYDETHQLSTLPPEVSYPIAVSICSDFPKLLGTFFPKLKFYEDCSFTIIVDRLFFPSNTAIVRIESGTKNQNKLVEVLNKLFFCHTSKESLIKEGKIKLANGFHNAYFTNSAIYLTKKELSQDTIAGLSNILPHRNGVIFEMYIDWNQLKTRVPQFIYPFVDNPIAPFNRVQTSYSYNTKSDSINEFTVATTGKEENEDFIKDLARKFFKTKLKAKQMDLSMTIKLQQEKDLVFVSTDFEQVLTWLSKKVDLLTSGIKSLLPKIFRPLLIKN